MGFGSESGDSGFGPGDYGYQDLIDLGLIDENYEKVP